MENIKNKNIKVLDMTFDKKKLLIFLSVNLIGFLLAIVYHYVKTFYLRTPSGSTFVGPWNIRFDDFTYLYRFANLFFTDQPVYETTVGLNMYMPIMVLVGLPFSYIKYLNGFYLYVSIVLAFFIMSYCYIMRGRIINKITTALIIILSSYPMLFLIDRGNLEGFVYIFVFLFIVMYSKKKYIASIIFLTIAFGLKPFCIVLAVLFLVDKKYKELMKFAIASTAAFILSLSVMPKGFLRNFEGLVHDMKIYSEFCVSGWQGLGFCHSLYNIPHFIFNKIGIYFPGGRFDFAIEHTVKNIYNIFIFVFFALICVYLFKYEKVFWRKVYLLVLFMISSPYIQYDYTFIEVYIPLILFFDRKPRRLVYYKYEKIIAVLSALLLIPKQYTHPFFISEPFGSVVNPVIILILIGAIVYYGMKEYYFELKNNVNEEEVSQVLVPIISSPQEDGVSATLDS